MTLPAPKDTPPLDAVPGRIMRLFAPMLAMVCWMAVDDPRPISIMAMTAATPMMMPSVVRAARMTFRRRPMRAVLSMRLSCTRLLSILAPPSAVVSFTPTDGFSSAWITPSLIRITRFADRATVSSWVTRITVTPSSSFSC